MILCGSLQDSDIPHRDNVREAIIDRWHRWFEDLKQELAVCPKSAFCCSCSFELGCSRPHQLYGRRMVLWDACFVSCPHCPLDLRRGARQITFSENSTNQISSIDNKAHRKEHCLSYSSSSESCRRRDECMLCSGIWQHTDQLVGRVFHP